MKTRLNGIIKNIKREGIGDVRIDFNANGRCPLEPGGQGSHP